MANWITISRLPVLIIVILLLACASPFARLVGAGLIIVLIAMDSIDGMVARKRGEISLLGSVLDVMVDRAVEQVMWVWLAHLQLIPVAIPIIVILRGTIVDALRGIHVRDGRAPLDVQRTRLGRWVVKSPMMRTGYAMAKCIAFTGLALAHALYAYAQQGAISMRIAESTHSIAWAVAWLATAFCIVRGLPVIIEQLPAAFRTAPGSKGERR